MKQIFTIFALVILASLFATPLRVVHAEEQLLFENDGTRNFNAQTLRINAENRAGNITLTFGQTLNEQLFWDSLSSKFVLTDDLDVQGTMSGSAVHAAGGNVTIATDGTSIFNANGTAVNFRIATDSETNMFFVDGTNDRIGIKTSSPEVELEVVGTVSGTTIHAESVLTSSGTLSIEGQSIFKDKIKFTQADGNEYIDSETDGDLDISATTGTDFNINSTRIARITSSGFSGSNVHAESVLTSSGTLSIDSGFYQDGMTDCDTSSTSKLLWDSTTGTFSCGTDTDTTNADQNLFETIAVSGESNVVADGTTDTLNFAAGSNVTITTDAGADTVTIAATDTDTQFSGTGALQSAFDNRYVNQSGDTMTGNLIIGNAATLSVSGAIITEGNLTINEDNGAADAILTFGNDAAAETLRFSDTTNGFIFSDDVEVQGTLSGSSLVVSGLKNCDTFDTDVNGSVSCGTDASSDWSGTGALQTAFDARYINQSGDTMTGALVIDNEGSEPSLNVRGTMSGTTIHAESVLTSSGTLSIEGSATITGKVGIGTDTASVPLHIFSETPTSAVAINADSKIVLDGTGDQYIQFRNETGAGDEQGILFSDNTELEGAILYNHSGRYFTMYAGGGPRLRALSNGALAIGSITATSLNLAVINANVGLSGGSQGNIRMQQRHTGNGYLGGNSYGDIYWNVDYGNVATSRKFIIAHDGESTDTNGTYGTPLFTVDELGVITIGNGEVGVDSQFLFDGQTNDGSFEWMEDENYFRFNDDVTVQGTLSGATLYILTGAIIENGNVGIGTTAPNAKLQVSGGGLCVGSDANCNTDNDTEGIVYSSSTSMTTYDLAEMYPTKDTSIGSGEIVSLDLNNGVFVKRAEAGDKKLIGIISTDPGALLGGFAGDQFTEEYQVAVALAGRVPVHVSTENGVIEVGDYLTISSLPGVARKANDGEQSIGYALQPYAKSEVGDVQVFIQLERAVSDVQQAVSAQKDVNSSTVEIIGGAIKVFGGLHYITAENGVVVDTIKEIKGGRRDQIIVIKRADKRQTIKVQKNEKLLLKEDAILEDDDDMLVLMHIGDGVWVELTRKD